MLAPSTTIPADSPAQSGFTDDITGSSNFNTVTTPWLVDATFTPGSAGDWQATGLGHVQGSINFLVDSQGNYIPIGASPGDNFEYPAVSPGDNLKIFAASLGIPSGSHLVGTTGDYFLDEILLTETLCAGAAACTADDEAILTVSIIGATSSTLRYTCATGVDFEGTCSSAGPSSNPILLSLGGQVSTLNVTDTYFLAVFDDGTDSLSSFINVFGEQETPEPSTLVLLGTALAGIGVLRRWRKPSRESD